MDVSSIKNYKPITLPNGMYEAVIVSAREITGSNPDEFGEYSEGLALKYKIDGPDIATLSNGDSAMGFQVEEVLWAPRSHAKPGYVDRYNKAMVQRLTAVFGEDYPEDIPAVDWSDHRVKIQTKLQWSDFNQEEVPTIQRVMKIN